MKLKLKEFKEKLHQLVIEVMAEATCDVLQFASAPTKAQSIGAGAGVGAAVALGMTAQVCAKPFNEALKDMLGNLYKWLIGISSAVAVVIIAWRILQYMMSSDPQTAKMAKDNIKKVIIAWVCINLLGALAATIQTLTAGQGWHGQQSDFN